MATRELDLHGHTWSEAKAEFIDFYNDALEQAGYVTGIQLTVIHGYGSTGEGGVLRKRLRGLLCRLEGRLEFTPGEEVDGNMGCTVVTPLKPIPEDDLLTEEIWDYCKRPRVRSKITGRFRRHGHPKVVQAIRLLEKQGRLTQLRRRGRIMYESG